MPFLAEHDGSRVIPEQVSDQTTVTCLSCGGEMKPKGPSVDGRARHFFHLSGGESCSGGESDEHRKMKSLAVSKLRQVFEGEFSRCAPEVSLNVQQTESEVNERRADALLEFEQERADYGSGLIIEVQFRNKGKEIPVTTKDYLESGYSVYWARPRDFTETQFQFDRLESAFKSDTNFAYSATDPVTVGDYDETDLLWEDPIPDCDHIWKDLGDVEFCARCRINRTYSNSRTRFLYDNMGFLGPLERPEVPKVPDVPDRNAKSDSTDGTSEVEKLDRRVQPHMNWPTGVPEECHHYNGPEHRWEDYGWADQGTAKCANCGTKVRKERLPDTVTIH